MESILPYYLPKKNSTRNISTFSFKVVTANTEIAIDHCLISETIELEDVSIGDFTGSDHLPLIVDLKI